MIEQDSQRRCTERGFFLNFQGFLGEAPVPWFHLIKLQIASILPYLRGNRGLQHKCLPVNFVIGLEVPFCGTPVELKCSTFIAVI